MKRFTVAILVNNQFGVLNRVTSMFRRRQFNIVSLAVSETESTEYSRITIQSEGEDLVKQQLINQLYKLPDVCSVLEFDPDESVSRELLLIKVTNDPETRAAVTIACDAYEGKIVDYNKESIMIQMVGDNRKINNFVNLMREYQILEICRTGIISLERGGSTIEKNLFI
ncbi:MAG: acetolactate synthase small subunit [Oscillospiraceae bacterium]|nr:acetolactate synthase small subunit [Oscillospiraceae bacterium]